MPHLTVIQRLITAGVNLFSLQTSDVVLPTNEEMYAKICRGIDLQMQQGEKYNPHLYFYARVKQQVFLKTNILCFNFFILFCYLFWGIHLRNCEVFLCLQ